MSRTDKDTPWWVSAVWWEPVHFRCVNAKRGFYDGRWDIYGNQGRECNLSPEPKIEYLGFTSRRRHCYWVPTSTGLPKNWKRTFGRGCAPRWFRNHIETAPTRVKVRDTCREAMKEYRGTGEVDIIPPIDQHRHCAGYYYW